MENHETREDGFYWVRRSGSWEVAEWSGAWIVLGCYDEDIEDHEFDEIDERPLSRGPRSPWEGTIARLTGEVETLKSQLRLANDNVHDSREHAELFRNSMLGRADAPLFPWERTA